MTVEVLHKAFEVVFGVLYADRKDARPAQLVDEDKDDVRFGAGFTCLSQTKTTGYTCASDSGSRFNKFPTFHLSFSNLRARNVRCRQGQNRGESALNRSGRRPAGICVDGLGPDRDDGGYPEQCCSRIGRQREGWPVSTQETNEPATLRILGAGLWAVKSIVSERLS